MRRIRDILIFGLCLLMAMAPMAQANSGPTQWEGVEGVGALIVDDDCPIVVEREVLTFDIQQFPEEYYRDAVELERYKASVTAEYTFHNPTGESVTATLLFPYGQLPQYVPDGTSIGGYGILVDGEPVQLTYRASHLHDGVDFDMERDLSRLDAGFMKHAFYSPEIAVTKYIYRVEGVDHETNRAAYAAMDIYPEEGRRVLGLNFNGAKTHKDFIRFGIFADQHGSGSEDIVFYVIGEPFEQQPQWVLYENGGCETRIAGSVSLVESEMLTFRELALTEFQTGYWISESDWYNAFVVELEQNDISGGCIGPDVQWNMARCTLRWFQYELTVPAGGTVVNRVKAPLYPAIHTAWEPPIYNYTYLLSPAQGWARFDSVDIRINTPFYMTQCNLDGFEETETGYALHLEGLPDKELEFLLSTVRDPDKPGTHGNRMLLLTVGVAVLIIGSLLRIRRR